MLSITDLATATNDNSKIKPLIDPLRLIDHLPCVAIQTDLIGKITYLSGNWESMTGSTILDCTDLPFQRFVHGEDVELLKELFSGRSQKSEISLTFRLVTASDKLIWVQFTAFPTSVDEVGAGIVGILSDISTEVGREESLLAQHRTTSGMLNDLPGMVYRCRNDPDWTMEYINEGSRALTGYKPKDVINNKKLSFASMIVEEDRDKVWNAVQRALREHSGFAKSYRIRCADGSIKLVWERGKGVYSVSGDLIGLEGFITDFSQLKGNLFTSDTTHLYNDLTDTLTEVLFNDRVACRERRFRIANNLDYAMGSIHIDNYARYCEQLKIHNFESSTVEIIERVKNVFSSTDSVYHNLTQDIKVLIDQCNSISQLENLASQLQDAFLEPVSLDGKQVYLTLSIGFAVSKTGEKNKRGNSLVEYSEIAMMNVHEIGGNGWRIYPR